jgi:hypothetical protein
MEALMDLADTIIGTVYIAVALALAFAFKLSEQGERRLHIIAHLLVGTTYILIAVQWALLIHWLALWHK